MPFFSLFSIPPHQNYFFQHFLIILFLCLLQEHVPSTEFSLPCQCHQCSPYREMKLQSYKEYLEASEDQENFGHKYPYLCDLVQENAEPYPYSRSVVEENVQAPPVVEKRDAETQTDPRQYRFTCKECGCQFNHEYYYEQHILVHRRLYECAFCNATFVTEKPFQTHVLLHMSKNHFECVYCSCVFSNKKHLVKHIGSHDSNLFECGECKAKFITDKGLQNHKKSHVSSGKMIHVFRLAKGTSSAQTEPVPQLAVVETAAANVYEEPPVNAPRFFECDACHIRFSNNHQLNRHSVIHKRKATDFLHFCTECGARFRRNNHLVCHTRHAHKK